MNKVQVTLEEKVKLEEQLDHLLTVKRPENIERLQIARSYGDLSENSEYDAAKDEQAHLDAEITHLTNLLHNIEVIDVNDFSDDIVTIGKTVTVKFLDTGSVETYHMVSNTSVDIFADKISVESPFGEAIKQHVEEDVVTVEAPIGKYEVKIVKIQRTK